MCECMFKLMLTDGMDQLECTDPARNGLPVTRDHSRPCKHTGRRGHQSGSIRASFRVPETSVVGENDRVHTTRIIFNFGPKLIHRNANYTTNNVHCM